MNHRYHNHEAQRQILASSRHAVIDWLKWNDPNGTYDDSDCDLEGIDRLTLEQARELMQKQIGESEDLFAKFAATGRDCSDLGEALQDECLEGRPGRLYCDSLFIEDTSDWNINRGEGRWYTQIGNREYQSDDLAEVEGHLFKFALSEGYIE